MDGLSRIANAFETTRRAGRAALMPYLTLGYPTPERSVGLVAAAAAAGADLLELGVPFSDPLADGPTIQHSTQVALQQGTGVARCLELLAQIRAAGVNQPALLMGYLNPVLAYGPARYVEDAARAGADGLILPDLPVEESDEIGAACAAHGLGLVLLAPPNADPRRLALLAGRTRGFLYLVSVQGVTGVRAGLPADLEDFVARARRAGPAPLAVGFGIATPAQAAAVGRIADGVIVGSAMVRAIDSNPGDPAAAVREYVSGLAQALKRGREEDRMK